MTGGAGGGDAHADDLTTQAERRAFRWRLGVIAVIALGVRLAYALAVAPHASQPGDSAQYHLLANALAGGRGYSTESSIFAGHPVPTAEHPPLYVLYLAFFTKLGLSTMNDHRAVSCVLGTLTVALIGLLGRRIAGSRAGLVAAGLAAVYPQLFVVDGTLISESIYTPLIVLSALAAYRQLDRRGVKPAALLGASIGLATLARPDGILLLVLLALPIAWTARFRRGLVEFAACAATCLVVLSPWLIRNQVALHRFPLISTNGGLTAPAANCPYTFFGRYTGFVNLQCAELIPACQAVTQEIPESECLERTAVTYVMQHKRRVPIVVLARVARAFQLFQYNTDIYYAGTWARTRGVAVAGLVMYAVLLPLGVGGALLLRRRRVFAVPLLLIVVGMAVPATSFGFSRYRIAADPALVALAAVALDQAWRRAVAVRRRRWALQGAVA